MTIAFSHSGLPICDPLPTKPLNGYSECFGKGELGTKCDFTCDIGYELVGHSHTVCEEMLTTARGKWSNPTPICIKGLMSFEYSVGTHLSHIILTMHILYQCNARISHEFQSTGTENVHPELIWNQSAVLLVPLAINWKATQTQLAVETKKTRQQRTGTEKYQHVNV